MRTKVFQRFVLVLTAAIVLVAVLFSPRNVARIDTSDFRFSDAVEGPVFFSFEFVGTGAVNVPVLAVEILVITVFGASFYRAMKSR